MMQNKSYFLPLVIEPADVDDGCIIDTWYSHAAFLWTLSSSIMALEPADLLNSPIKYTQFKA